VCEPGSVFVSAVVPSRLARVAACIEDGKLVVASEMCPINVTVRVVGTRRGRGGVRFPEYTKEQMAQNEAFWASSVNSVR